MASAVTDPGSAAAQDAQAGGVVDDQAVSPISPERLAWHIPDPERAREGALERLEQARQTDDKTEINRQTRIVERIGTIRRPRQMHLTLENAIRRTLANNYLIQVLSYNPAIEATRVVEAEAAFDAAFFANVSKNNVDRPTGSQLMPADLDFVHFDTGIRKLLPTGMQISGRYELERTWQAFQFQQINPEYVSRFIVEGRQPLLRNFGLDYNRSLIVLAQNERRVSDLTFRRQIRDTLRSVEEVYWRLVQARRDVVISARVLAEFEAIYEYLVARKEFDVTPVQLSATLANLEQARADFVRRRATVFDAEDRLIAIMDDPEINLADELELIPEDFPVLERTAVDRLGEVQAALDNRTEIKEQDLRIASAKILEDRAANAEWPRLDLSLRVTFDGLSGTADRSFDEVTRGKFIEYYVGVEFEVPIGNRGPRAARQRARLERTQAVARLRDLLEGIILDVNLAVRRMETSYDQIGPNFESAQSREREATSLIARAERKDHNTLISELGAWQGLANIRRAMLNAMVEYNIAIVDLERAKGTLLQYNNVVIPTEIE